MILKIRENIPKNTNGAENGQDIAAGWEHVHIHLAWQIINYRALRRLFDRCS
jgi:hypothetical protein